MQERSDFICRTGESLFLSVRDGESNRLRRNRRRQRCDRIPQSPFVGMQINSKRQNWTAVAHQRLDTLDIRTAIDQHRPIRVAQGVEIYGVASRIAEPNLRCLQIVLKLAQQAVGDGNHEFAFWFLQPLLAQTSDDVRGERNRLLFAILRPFRAGRQFGGIQIDVRPAQIYGSRSNAFVCDCSKRRIYRFRG